MTIKERTEAARWVFEDTLRSHRGFIQTVKALSRAVDCFFSSRKVRSWQEINRVNTTQAAVDLTTGMEDQKNTTVSERTTIIPDLHAELESAFKKRALTRKSLDDVSESHVENSLPSDGVEAGPVAKPQKIMKSSVDDKLKPGHNEQLSHTAAYDKMKARPKNRRAPTRRPLP